MNPARLPFWLRVVAVTGVAILTAGAVLGAYRHFTRPVTLTVALRSADGEPVNYENLGALANERLKGAEEITQAQVLPAIGAALGGVREGFLTTNLLKSGRPISGRTRALSIVNVTLTCLLVLALIAWGVSYPIRDELRLRQLRTENQKLEPSVAALRAMSSGSVMAVPGSWMLGF